MPGASLEELAEAESALKCRFPPVARLLYRLCNGQSIPQAELDVEDEYQEDAHFVGLIGGYNFSHHYVNVHLLSLCQVMSLTNRIPPLRSKRKSAQPYPQKAPKCGFMTRKKIKVSKADIICDICHIEIINDIKYIRRYNLGDKYQRILELLLKIDILESSNFQWIESNNTFVCLTCLEPMDNNLSFKRMK